MTDEHSGEGHSVPRGAGEALALGGASRDKADAWLEEQTRLARLQADEMERQDKLRDWSLRVRHVSDVMKLGFELAVALIVIAIATFIGAAIWNAAEDNGLIIEVFSVPPDLANRGLTGQVVAAKLLDRLSALQAETKSSRASSSYANNWGDDIKVQIPDTGVSIGELNKYLHAWLGHETLISGEIYHTASGIAVTARAGGHSSPTFTGKEADLDTLIQKAAESVYGATQPYRYAVYLMSNNRPQEARAAYGRLLVSNSLVERSWALIGLANLEENEGHRDRQLKILLHAVSERPDFIMGYSNLEGYESAMQHDEQEYFYSRKIVSAGESGDADSDLDPNALQLAVLNAKTSVAADLGDYRDMVAVSRKMLALPNVANYGDTARLNIVSGYAYMHDRKAMSDAMASLPPAADANAVLNRHANWLLANFVMGNWAVAAQEFPKVQAMVARLGPIADSINRRQLWPSLAIAKAEAGDFAAAHALIDRSPLDCEQCLRYRAGIDALEKNWKGSAYWYARAVAFAPSLPAARMEWGRMLLAKGDPDGAIGVLRAAHEKGPHYADPLEYWGEALIARNRSDLALAKFEEAAKYAPDWGRLHLKWGEALLYSGDKSGARAQFALASRLYLMPDEKAALVRMERLHG
jgi:tetratricopeptide (TPR) repeat protein